MNTKTDWSVSDISNPIVGPLDHEFQDRNGEWHHFIVLITEDRFVFGGATNSGFLESGYMIRSADDAPTDDFIDLEADLETYYNDGPGYTLRIVCNQRM